MRPLLSLGLVLALATTAAAGSRIERDPLARQRTVVITTSIVVLDDITFEPGSARLTRTSRPMLEAVAETLRAFDEVQLELVGPRRRAAAVRDALIDGGVAPGRLSVRAALTRSVEFHVLAP